MRARVPDFTIEYFQRVTIVATESVIGTADSAIQKAAVGLEAYAAELARVLDVDGAEIGLVQIVRKKTNGTT